MNRILLINPSANVDRTSPDIQIDIEKKINVGSEPAFPLGVICLGSYLKEKGFDVTIIDSRVHSGSEFDKILMRELEGVFIVGISVMTSCIKDTLKILNRVKGKNKNIKTVLGGIHPSLFPEQTVKNPLVDFVVFGEGELPLGAVADKLLNGKDDFELISNLCFKKGEEIFFKNELKFIDVNDLPIPDYSLVDYEKYITRNIYDNKWLRQLEYQSSRGCPSRCSFCVNTIINKKRWRQKDPEKVLKEIQFLKKTYKLDNVFFIDENFFPKKKNVEAIVSGIKKLNITWEANARADYFHEKYINDSFMEFLSSSGLMTIRMGIESGSPEVLKFLKKDITTSNIIKAQECCSKFGIFTSLSFMIGLPYETMKNIKETLNIIHRVEEIAGEKVFVIGPQIFRPYPGGEIYSICKKEGLKEPDSFEKWPDLTFLETGYVDDFYWMKNKTFVKLVVLLRSFYSDRKVSKTGWSLSRKIIRGIFYRFAWFRVNFNFYSFLVDMRLAYLIKRLSKGAS